MSPGRGSAGGKKLVKSLNYISEHVVGKEIKNSLSMGLTGAHLGQRDIN